MTARLSRNLRSGPLGKGDAKIPETRVPSEVKDILTAEAAKLGMGLSEFLRELCVMRAYGPEHVKRLQAERSDMVWGMSEESRGRR